MIVEMKVMTNEESVEIAKRVKYTHIFSKELTTVDGSTL